MCISYQSHIDWFCELAFVDESEMKRHVSRIHLKVSFIIRLSAVKVISTFSIYIYLMCVNRNKSWTFLLSGYFTAS